MAPCSDPEPVAGYRCPGDAHAIPRAVHLGRLARFYPGCRQCEHRDDTGTLSAKVVKRLVEVRTRAKGRSLFGDEGASGVYLNELGPAEARGMAAAMGVLLARASEASPTVVIAGDGRPIAAELVAAVAEGLRWAGCHVVDIGPATSACLMFSVDHLQTQGGVLVGNPGDRPECVGLKFWADGARPCSAGPWIERIEAMFRARVDRPTRRHGSLRRFQADAPYLGGIAEWFHALRPLHVMVDSASGPWTGYLKRLAGAVECRVIARRTTGDGLAEQVVAQGVDFAVRIDGDGETCRLWDEQGRGVPAERVLLWIARELLREVPGAAVVLEDMTSPALADALEALGARVVRGGACRAEMAQALREQGSRIGGGPSARSWHGRSGLPLPDALMTVAWLLRLLSRGDERLSEVLDREAALG